MTCDPFNEVIATCDSLGYVKILQILDYNDTHEF